MDKKPSIFTYGKAHHGHVISGLPQEHEGMWSCAYQFGISYRPSGLNSNTFLGSSNCFVCLRKKSTCFVSKMLGHFARLLVTPYFHRGRIILGNLCNLKQWLNTVKELKRKVTRGYGWKNDTTTYFQVCLNNLFSCLCHGSIFSFEHCAVFLGSGVRYLQFNHESFYQGHKHFVFGYSVPMKPLMQL